MGKRLVRINNKDISTHVQELLGREVNLVMFNKNVLHGTITELQENTFKIKDMVLRNHDIKFSEVSEIIYDKEAVF